MNLLPCPFCGGSAIIEMQDNLRDLRIWGGYAPWTAHCVVCGADGPKRKEKRQAIAAWNTRTQEEK